MAVVVNVIINVITISSAMITTGGELRKWVETLVVS